MKDQELKSGWVHLRVSETEAQRLKDLAWRQRTSVSDLTRQALRPLLRDDESTERQTPASMARV